MNANIGRINSRVPATTRTFASSPRPPRGRRSVASLVPTVVCPSAAFSGSGRWALQTVTQACSCLPDASEDGSNPCYPSRNAVSILICCLSWVGAGEGSRRLHQGLPSPFQIQQLKLSAQEPAGRSCAACCSASTIQDGAWPGGPGAQQLPVRWPGAGSFHHLVSTILLCTRKPARRQRVQVRSLHSGHRAGATATPTPAAPGPGRHTAGQGPGISFPRGLL